MELKDSPVSRCGANCVFMVSSHITSCLIVLDYLFYFSPSVTERNLYGLVDLKL